MGIKFSNNADAVLSAGITAVATTLTLTANGADFPEIVNGSGDYFYFTITNIAGVREICKCTHHTSGSNTFQVIERGVDGTTGTAYSAADKVQIRLPRIALDELVAAHVANAAAIASNDTDIAALQAKDTADEQKLYAPTGLTMYIYNPAGEIPTGWSAKSGPADALLAIAGGSNAYNVAGETLAGSWTPTGHTHTIAHLHTITHTHDIAHTHEGGSHALTTAELAVHSHSGDSYYPLYDGVALGSDGAAHGYGISNSITSGSTSNAGSGNAHSHGTTVSQSTETSGASSAANTGAVDTANSGSSKEPSTDRPYAAVGLLIERS
jgi:hypothetical protein